MNNWYKTLKKSPLTPPDYVFSIVWPILYLMIFGSIGINLYNKPKFCLNCPITFFGLQLIFNLIWTTIFFRYKQILLGLIDLLLVIIFTIIYMTKVNDISLYLMIPYICWLCFAFYLNLHTFNNN
jgi:translocator protein